MAAIRSTRGRADAFGAARALRRAVNDFHTQHPELHTITDALRTAEVGALATLEALGADLLEIRKLMADWSLECDCETHTYDGKPMVVVDESGKVVEYGGGYFAWPDGTRITKDNQPSDWPTGHVATPCGKCWACRLSALGCGLLSIYDGAGRRDVSLRERR